MSYAIYDTKKSCHLWQVKTKSGGVNLKRKNVLEKLKNLDDSYQAVTTEFVGRFCATEKEQKRLQKIELFEKIRQSILCRDTIGFVRESTRKKANGWGKRIAKEKNRLKSKARRHLNKLVQEGILEKKKDGRRNIYLLNGLNG